MSDADTMGSWAMRYARAGIPVFPLRPGTKQPATSNGFYDATTDEQRVEGMWKSIPAANIGTPTGRVFSVLDIDGAEGMEWAGQILSLPYFPLSLGKVRTAANREDEPHMHIYIPPTEGRSIGFLPGVDGLGTDGYAVLPPSVVDERGEPNKPWKWGTYEWIEEPDYEELRRKSDALGEDQGGPASVETDIPF